MVIAIAEGKADKVKERLANYSTTKMQKDKLNDLLAEAIKSNDLIADDTFLKNNLNK